MTAHGRDDGNSTYDLPEGWAAVSPEVQATAVQQARAAVTCPDTIDRLARYYCRDKSYAGTLFLDAEPNDPYSVGAADLYAVTTLSMTLTARQGRLLLDEGDTRTHVLEYLSKLPTDLHLTHLETSPRGSAETLSQMQGLHSTFRTLLGPQTNRWVFGAKLCARKRPLLFPVRDSVVCRYLGDGRPLKRGDGWPGDIAVDIQVFAHLMADAKLVDGLANLRNELLAKKIVVDAVDLRLLDAVLWVTGKKMKITTG